jgi:Cu-Zn family superoxide dismutase
MKRVAVAAAAVLVVGLVDPAGAQTPGPITADFKDQTGQTIGKVTATAAGAGMDLAVEVSGLKPGQHGLHLHAVGKCDGPDFMSAAGHFNPLGRQHGVRNPRGSHLGDLPNLPVAADGSARLTTRSMATLTAGPGSIFDPDGTALVIHADPDDETTDPTGNSGGRVACAVLAGGGPAAQPAAPPASQPAGPPAAPPAGPAAAQPVRPPAQLPRTGAQSATLAPLAGLLGGLLAAAGLLARRRLR